MTILVIVAIAIVAGIALRDYFTIDACLDSGGRWNADLRVCER